MRHSTTAVLAVVAAAFSSSPFGALASTVDDHAVVLGAHDQFVVLFLNAFRSYRAFLLMVFSLYCVYLFLFYSLPSTASSSSGHHHHAAGLSQPPLPLPLPNLIAGRGSDSNSPSLEGCIDPNPQNTLTDRMNVLLNSSGPGYILSLCQGQEYYITAPLIMSAEGQEISTIGYPIEEEDGTDLRATLVVNGPVSDGTGHTTAIAGMFRLFGYFWITTTAQLQGYARNSSANSSANDSCLQK